MSRWIGLFLLSVFLVFGGCLPIPLLPACLRSEDCPPEKVCRKGRCLSNAALDAAELPSEALRPEGREFVDPPDESSEPILPEKTAERPAESPPEIPLEFPFGSCLTEIGPCTDRPGKLFEWCTSEQGCEAPFLCYLSRCYRSCSRSEPKACSSLPDLVCNDTFTDAFCKYTCNAQEGTITNPKCPTGMQCETKSLVCAPLQPPQAGEVGFQKPCIPASNVPAKACDARQSLACISGRCEVVCDPKNPVCKATQRCIASGESFRGGFCSP